MKIQAHTAAKLGSALLLFSLLLPSARSQGVGPYVTMPGLHTGGTPTYPFAQNASALGSVPAAMLDSGYATGWMTNQSLLEWWSADTISTNDGSVVTQWMGRNGNVLQGNAYFYSRAVNGRPGLYFNGAATILTNGTVLGWQCTNACTVFILFKYPRQQPTSSLNAIIDGSSSEYSVEAAFFLNGMGFNNWDGPVFYAENGGAHYLDSESFHNGDDVKVWCVTWGNSYGGDYWDGKLDNSFPYGYSWNQGNPWQPDNFSGELSVGAKVDDSHPFTGFVSELLIFTNQLSPQAVDQVNSYLMAKYNMIRPTIALYGDSMMAGGVCSWGGQWADILSSNFPNWTIDNVAVPGASSQQVLSNVVVSQALTASAGNPRVAIVWDNLENGSESLGTITNNHIAMGMDLQSNGWITLLVDPPSNGYSDTNKSATGTSEALRFAYQAWATNCWSNNFNGLIDLSRDPYVGYSNAFTNIIYYPPGGYVNGVGTHWTNAGYFETAPYVISAINAAVYGTYQTSTTNAPPPTAAQPWWCNYGNHVYYNSNGVWALIH